MRFHWSEGDFFVIPNWAVHEHIALEESYLFSASDLPIMERFDLERVETLENPQEVKDEFQPLLP